MTSVALLLFACVRPAAVPASAPSADSREILVLHTNDQHGHYLPERAPWLDGEPEIGGTVLLDQYIRGARQSHGAERTLLLDGGDLLSGTPLTDMEVRGSKGGAMLDVLEILGYDAWAIGNHELDKGWQNTSAFVADSKVQVLSANLVKESGGMAFPGQAPSKIYTLGDVTVGVIGATTEGMDYLVSSRAFEGLDIEPVLDTVGPEVARLRPQVDLVVLLTHIGVEEDQAIAEAVPGIDLIVGGHSHTYQTPAIQTGSTWIVQAGSYARSLGSLQIRVGDNGGIESLEYTLVDLVPAAAPSDPRPEVEAMVAQYDEEIRSFYDVEIGSCAETLTRDYYRQSPLGSWATDMMRAETGAELAMYNGGGLRSDLPAGPIQRRDLYNIFPFGNEVVTFQISGTELMALLLANVMAAEEESRGAIQVSGTSLVWREVMSAPEVVKIEVNGQPLEPERLYTVATNSYVVDQAERYLAGAVPKNVEPTGQSVFELANNYVSRVGEVTLPGDARLTRLP
jgi:2',3'-cyclic-nucleotide 2'-phosphodiesterase (5'-nucleotidase family)